MPSNWFLSFHIETEAWSSLEIFIVKNGLIQFYCVWPTLFRWNEVHLNILALATDEFQKSLIISENAMFLEMRKNIPLAEFQKFGVFQVR